MKNKIRPYLSFSKKERTGMLILVTLCLFFFSLPYFIRSKQLEVTVEMRTVKPGTNNKTDSVIVGIKLLPFNPNTIDLNTWMKLGLSEKLAKRIVNYRNKGGRFRQPADLGKIWGIPTELVESLIPYVVLPDEQPLYSSKSVIEPIDINTANQQDWEALPGIGQKLAERIIRFREQSSGFARITELQNVYGLSDSVFLKLQFYLRLQNATIPKLPLNRASVYQLVKKTGMPVEIARAIVNWRLENGPFVDWAELEKMEGYNAPIGESIRKAFQLE